MEVYAIGLALVKQEQTTYKIFAGHHTVGVSFTQKTEIFVILGVAQNT